MIFPVTKRLLLSLLLLIAIFVSCATDSAKAYETCSADDIGLGGSCCSSWQVQCWEYEVIDRIHVGGGVYVDVYGDCISSGVSCTQYTTCPSECTSGSSDPDPVLPYCGDGICQNPGSCDCPADCGSCSVASCGDGSCNGGENSSSCPGDCPPAGETCGNGTCGGGENCNNCSADCGSCATGGGCGNGVCDGGESCSSCASDCGTCSTIYCGDGLCNGSENCSSCSNDCGDCSTSFCGDSTCDPDESCASCANDCGSCNETGAWWQAQGGHVYSGTRTGIAIRSLVPDETTCISPSCIANLLIRDGANVASSYGYPLTAGGGFYTNGYTNEGDIFALGTRQTRLRETYEYFLRNSDIGLNPDNDFEAEENDIQEPLSSGTYFHSGDLVLQSAWNVGSSESYVVFIDGDLTIQDPGGLDQLTTVAEGGFLAFIVSGDITIADNVGYTDFVTTNPNLEGMFVANGTLTIASKGSSSTDERFKGAGTFVGWTGVDLQRDYDDGGSGADNNLSSPVESFSLLPALTRYAPDFMKQPRQIWQERN